MTKKLDFLIGASFADLIFQPTAGIIAPDNMLIINFKNENILYSIHAVCSVRINKGDKFLLNSSDEFVDENHSYLMEDNVDKSILKINIDKTKEKDYNKVNLTNEVTFTYYDYLKYKLFEKMQKAKNTTLHEQKKNMKC